MNINNIQILAAAIDAAADKKDKKLDRRLASTGPNFRLSSIKRFICRYKYNTGMYPDKKELRAALKYIGRGIFALEIDDGIDGENTLVTVRGLDWRGRTVYSDWLDADTDGDLLNILHGLNGAD